MAVSKPLRYQILKRDRNKCKACGRGPDEVKLHIDHVVPTALGGSDDPSNLQTLCADCNGGKAAVPADAPMVADVAEDARRWAQAMAVVAEERAADREVRQGRHAAFLSEWSNWTYQGKWQSGGYERLHYDLPGGWQNSIDQFVGAGLDLADLQEMVNVAMGSQSPDKWRYFCGCCWKRIKQGQERAAAMLSDKPVDDRITIRSRWTWDDIIDACVTTEEEMRKHYGDDFNPAMLSCEHEDACGDTLCRIYTAAWHSAWLMHQRKEVSSG